MDMEIVQMQRWGMDKYCQAWLLLFSAQIFIINSQSVNLETKEAELSAINQLSSIVINCHQLSSIGINDSPDSFKIYQKSSGLAFNFQQNLPLQTLD